MILGVSAEQEELRASVRRFLADRAPMSRVRELMDGGETDWAVWEQAGAQLGLQGRAIPRAYGGGGAPLAPPGGGVGGGGAPPRAGGRPPRPPPAAPPPPGAPPRGGPRAGG